MRADLIASSPALEPVTRTEAKTWCRVDGTDEDDAIDVLIAAARQLAEDYTNRCFVSQGRQLVMDTFPDAFELSRSPVSSVDSVTYLDEAGATQNVSTPVYWADTSSDPARLSLREGQTWPSDTRDFASAIISYTAGYSATPANVPAAIRQAVLLTVAHLYANREAQAMPEMAVKLLRPYRVQMWR
jgi:uncharacterized phiE125 gp8 family phage protein